MDRQPDDAPRRPGFGEFLETLPEALVLLHADGSLRAANRAARTLLGLAGPSARCEAAAALRVALVGVVDEIRAAGGGREVRLRLALLGRGPVRVLARATCRSGYALLIRDEAPRDTALHRALMERRGLSAGDARLALRVSRGTSNAAIARALGIGQGAVRMRVSRLCARLGVRGRAALTLVVSATLRVTGAPPGEP